MSQTHTEPPRAKVTRLEKEAADRERDELLTQTGRA